MDTDSPELPARIDPQRDTPSPLYLAPAGQTWVGLDGPALRISQPDRAERLYPLRRIGRVHTNQRVDWEQDALLACAEAGIPVLFLDDDGRILARLLGRPGQRDELRGRLIEFLLRPEAAGMLRHWMDQHRHRAARWAALKLGAFGTKTRRNRRSGVGGLPLAVHPNPAAAGAPPLTPPTDLAPSVPELAGTRDTPPALRAAARTAHAADIRTWINRRAERLAGADAALHSRQWLRGLAYGWMEEHLADLGFGRTTEVAQAGAPPLAADLTDIFYWYLEPARIGWLTRRHLAARRRGQPLRPPTYRDTVRLFESGATRAAARGRELTGSLHRWLIHEGD